MESTYQAMRTFADSWGLLYLFLIFCGVINSLLNAGAERVDDHAA
ncbi:MAG: cbb3-type cytochrome c oxidase subunit 3, partial [Pseudomonadota bacterium]